MIKIQKITTTKNFAELKPEDIARVDRAIPADAKMYVKTTTGAMVLVTEDCPLIIEWTTSVEC